MTPALYDSSSLGMEGLILGASLRMLSLDWKDSREQLWLWEGGQEAADNSIMFPDRSRQRWKSSLPFSCLPVYLIQDLHLSDAPRVFPLPLNLSGNILTDSLKGLSQGDPKPSQIYSAP